MSSERLSTWIGVCLPRLAIEVFLRGCGPAQAQQWRLAVCDRNAVLLPSPAAEAAGVMPGTRRASALALCPDLVVVERNPAREAEALQQAACCALQFTPAVSLQPGNDPRHAPSGLLIEVGASLRLFGGRTALLARLRTGLEALGVSASIACAPTPGAAWLLARHQDGMAADGQAQVNARLARLPLALLEEAMPHLATLASIGAHTLGDLAQLPRAGMAKRFGKALIEGLDRAFGRTPEPRGWFEAPLNFRARLELMADVETTEALLFGAQRLISQLAAWLGARRAAVQAFTLAARHDAIPESRFQIRLADPSRETARLMTVLRETLAAHRLPAPAHTLALECDEVRPLGDRSDDLFPMPVPERESLGRLVERLQARLGREQVQRLLVVADHRPEAAYRLQAFDAAQGPGAKTGTVTTEATAIGGLPRPLWLLEKPTAVTERNNRPYWHGPLTLLAGPERIESGWWDGNLVQRDYFIAADASGALVWIYRERLPDTDTRQGWFIHGRFG